MKFKDHKLAEFKLNSDLSEESTLKAMDLIFNFMNRQKSEPSNNRLTDFYEFNESENWHKVDLMEEFRKKAKQREERKLD